VTDTIGWRDQGLRTSPRRFGIGILGAARVRSSANLIVSSRIFVRPRGLFYAAIPSQFISRFGAHIAGVRQNADFL
jgi:hypothetical protein